MTDTLENLKARAEAVGITWDDANEMLCMYPPGPDTWVLEGRLFTEEERKATSQAAEDIIKAAELRQMCLDCEGRKTKPYFNMRDVNADLVEYLDCPTCNGTGKRKEADGDD